MTAKRVGIMVVCALLIGAGPAAAGNCPLGRELAARSTEVFKTDQKKGLAGLLQARKYCPEDAGIAYNLGLAYYRYKRPDLAYAAWSALAGKQGCGIVDQPGIAGPGVGQGERCRLLGREGPKGSRTG